MTGIEAFLGSWRETEKTGFDEMADALVLPPEKKEFFKQARTEITYKKDANDKDSWVIEVGVQGIPGNRQFPLRLGEPYDSMSIDGSQLKSVMTPCGDRFVEKHTEVGSNGMEMNIERSIENGKMIVITKVGPLQMKSVYEKI